MTKKVILDDSIFDAVSNTVAPLPVGLYTLEILTSDITTIKTGKHSGKPVINLQLKTVENRRIWKQIPMWMPNAADASEIKWLAMSRKALADALQITSQELLEAPERIIGMLVTTKLGIQQNTGYDPQNFVVTFIAD
jgi:hypothetical protein